MQMWSSSGSLILRARQIIAAGGAGSTAEERAALAALFEDRARSFRALYRGENSHLPQVRQRRPWMEFAAREYEDLARTLQSL